MNEGEKERLHRWKRRGDSTDDSVADGNAMQREKVCECRNGGTARAFLIVFTLPLVLQVLPTPKAYTGLRVPMFVYVKNGKRG
jgi:hypothetical protein